MQDVLYVIYMSTKFNNDISTKSGAKQWSKFFGIYLTKPIPMLISDQLHQTDFVKSREGTIWLSRCQQISEDTDDKMKTAKKKILFKIRKNPS